MKLLWVGHIRTDTLSKVGVSSAAVWGLGWAGAGDPWCCSAEWDPGAVLGPTQCTAHARARGRSYVQELLLYWLLFCESLCTCDIHCRDFMG